MRSEKICEKCHWYNDLINKGIDGLHFGIVKPTVSVRICWRTSGESGVGAMKHNRKICRECYESLGNGDEWFGNFENFWFWIHSGDHQIEQVCGSCRYMLELELANQ